METRTAGLFLFVRGALQWNHVQVIGPAQRRANTRLVKPFRMFCRLTMRGMG